MFDLLCSCLSFDDDFYDTYAPITPFLTRDFIVHLNLEIPNAI